MLKEKQRLILNNAMELGENISDDAKGKGRVFVSRFIEAGVAHYEEFGDVLITKETLNNFIHTMVGCPVIIKHKDIDDKNADKERVGVVSKVWFNEYDGWFYCEGIIWDKQAIDLVKNQGWSVSCTYDFDTDNQPKTHNGKKIDMEFTGGEFLHLALVPNPRYERANIVMNSKDKDDKDGRWITVKGTHVFIPDGKEVEEVIHEKGWEEQKEDDELVKLDVADKPTKESQEAIDKERQRTQKIAEEHKKEYEKSKDIDLTKLKLDNPSKSNKETYYDDDAEEWYTSAYEENIKKDYENYLKELEEKKKAEKKEEPKKEDKFRYDGKTKIKQVTKEEWNKTPKDYKMIKDGQKYLVYLDKESGATVLGKAEILEEKKKEKNNTKNSTALNSKGDLSMSVFKDLENFIKGVVSNAVDKEEEEKFEEEKEIAENEEEKEEKEEKKEVKEEVKNKKAKNKEEKEEVEEEVEEEKEEVKNKCKNSMDDVKKIIMGGKSEPQKLYLSKEERFALGEKY